MHQTETETSDRADAAAYRLIVENAVDLIVRGDAARNRIFVSPSSREVLGFEPAELLGRHAYQLVHPKDLDRVAATFGMVGTDNPRLDLVFRMRRKDGRYIWVEARYRHLAEDNGILAIIRDISAQKSAEQRLAEANAKLAEANRALQEMAHRDGLTGLANRRHFDESLLQAFRGARRRRCPLGLLMLDIDHFKAYNDRYGHIAGDARLRRVACAVQEVVRRPDDIAARYGGEEFAVLLPATDLEGAIAVGDTIRLAIGALLIEHLGSPSGTASVSVGASSVLPRTTDRDPVRLVDTADRALYRAKAGGRNQVCGLAMAGLTGACRRPRQ